jgi:hypothetical protein
LGDIGRSFIIYDRENPHIKRQYTIANAMIPEVKKSLLELIEHVVKGCDEVPELNKQIYMDG